MKSTVEDDDPSPYTSSVQYVEGIGPVLFSWYHTSRKPGVDIYVDAAVDTVFAINKLIKIYRLYESGIWWVQHNT